MDHASGIQVIDSTKLYLGLDTMGQSGKQGDTWKTRSPGIIVNRDCEFFLFDSRHFQMTPNIFEFQLNLTCYFCVLKGNDGHRFERCWKMEKILQ